MGRLYFPLFLLPKPPTVGQDEGYDYAKRVGIKVINVGAAVVGHRALYELDATAQGDGRNKGEQEGAAVVDALVFEQIFCPDYSARAEVHNEMCDFINPQDVGNIYGDGRGVAEAEDEDEGDAQ